MGVLEEGGWRDLDQQSKERIEEAFRRAEEEPEPEPESALEDVYA